MWLNSRVVLIHVAVLLLVQVLGLLLGVPLSLLAVEVVKALGLKELVDLSAGDAGEHFLGELVLDGLACATSNVSILTMNEGE